MKKLLLFLCFACCTLTLFAEEQCQKGYIDCQGHCGRFVDANHDTYCDLSPLSPELQAQLFPPEVKEISSNYWLIQILIGVAVLYLLSLFFVKWRLWTKTTHRKVWNLLLAITFIVSGLLGLLLVIFINYNIHVSDYNTWLTVHVDFGIAMALISIIHLVWHWSYYMNMFSKRKN